MEEMIRETAAVLVLYHGSPNDNVNFDLFRGWAYFAFHLQQARDYALGKVSFTGKTVKTRPTVYKVEINAQKIADFRGSGIRREYETRRVKWNARHPGVDDFIPSYRSEGFIHSHTGLPTWGKAVYIHNLFPEYDGCLLTESVGFTSLCLFSPRGKVRVIDKQYV
jgi:hypothetical protein